MMYRDAIEMFEYYDNIIFIITLFVVDVIQSFHTLLSFDSTIGDCVCEFILAIWS